MRETTRTVEREKETDGVEMSTESFVRWMLQSSHDSAPPANRVDVHGKTLLPLLTCSPSVYTGVS